MEVKFQPRVHRYSALPNRCDHCDQLRVRCTEITVGRLARSKTITLCPECFERLASGDDDLLAGWYRALYRLSPTNWANLLLPSEKWLLDTARGFTRCTEKADVSQDGKMMHLIDKLASMLDEGVVK